MGKKECECALSLDLFRTSLDICLESIRLNDREEVKDKLEILLDNTKQIEEDCGINLKDIENKIKEVLPTGVFTMPKDEIESMLININAEITKKFMKCAKW